MKRNKSLKIKLLRILHSKKGLKSQIRLMSSIY